MILTARSSDRFADGDPVHPDVFERLDVHEDRERCGPPDPELLELLPGRYLVNYGEPPTDEDLALLGNAARVRWVYRQLHLIEVETQRAEAIAALPGVAGVVPAWRTLGTTRTLAVGLNAVSTFAERQTRDEEAVFRHPSGVGYPILTTREGGKVLDLDPELELPTPPALIPVVNMSLGTTTVGFPTAVNEIVNLATLGASSEVLVVVAAGNCGTHGGDSMSAWARPDWVLSVGATDDTNGTRLAPYSSRGSPGPDLVAFGHSALNDKRHGTSRGSASHSPR